MIEVIAEWSYLFNAFSAGVTVSCLLSVWIYRKTQPGENLKGFPDLIRMRTYSYIGLAVVTVANLAVAIWRGPLS